MALVAEVILRGVSKQQYNQVRDEVGWLERKPDGGLAHLTWWEGEDCHNMDGWESEATFDAFVRDRLAPGMAALGINVQPEVTFHEAHEVYAPQALTVT